MEVPRLGGKLELQLLACATATATPDPSLICNLHHSSQQQILNSLNEARDLTQNLMAPSRIRFHWATVETPQVFSFLPQIFCFSQTFYLSHTLTWYVCITNAKNVLDLEDPPGHVEARSLCSSWFLLHHVYVIQRTQGDLCKWSVVCVLGGKKS